MSPGPFLPLGLQRHLLSEALGRPLVPWRRAHHRGPLLAMMLLPRGDHGRPFGRGHAPPPDQQRPHTPQHARPHPGHQGLLHAISEQLALPFGLKWGLPWHTTLFRPSFWARAPLCLQSCLRARLLKLDNRSSRCQLQTISCSLFDHNKL